MAIPKKIRELSKVVKLHANWLVYTTLGEDALTKDEIKELVQYGKLPMDKSLDLVSHAYLLGRLKALLKKSEFKQVSYEEVVDKASTLKLTAIEELVLEQARLKAGTYLKNLSTEINNGVFDSLAASLGTVISEATIRDLVADEVELALIQKKSAQELASSLAVRLQTGPKKTWKKVAQTELHRAKIAGHAQAIANKLDIYAQSDGVESSVSIVPSPQCCADCTDHYVDSNGNPKIFKLKELLAAGSNDSVSHAKKSGKHIHWKTTLPPLHPSCGCQLTYIPPGYGWSTGKLSLLQKSLFEETIQKARSGVSGGIASTVKPRGAPSQRKEAGVPSQPGAPAPGNVAGPGRPSSNPATPPKPPAPPGGGGGGSVKYSPCPFGGGADCLKHGGNSAEQHKTGGSILKKHQEAIARGAKPKTTEAKEEHEKQEKAKAAAYDATPHPRDVILTYLSEGDLSSVEELGEDEKGANTSFKATISGHGSGCMKPPPKFEEHLYSPNADFVDGLATTPKDKGHHSEVAAYQLAMSLGLVDHVPVTTLRSEPGIGENMSIQQWQENMKPIGNVYKDNPALGQAYDRVSKGYGDVKALLSLVPDEHKSAVENKLREIAILDFIMNNNDRYYRNLVFAKDLSDVRAIDHGLCFAAGLQGHKNTLANGFQKYHSPLTVLSHLYTQFKARSLSDTERGSDGTSLSAWQVIHTHLRMKFLAHLQDVHGHLPKQATRSAQYNAAYADSDEPVATHSILGGAFGWQGKDKLEKDKECQQVAGEGQLPDQVFASFAKQYITDGAADPNHPEHEDCKRMLQLKPLVPPGHGWHENAIGSKASNDYWDSIPAYSGSGFTGVKNITSEITPVRTVPAMQADTEATSLDIEQFATENMSEQPTAVDIGQLATESAPEQLTEVDIGNLATELAEPARTERVDEATNNKKGKHIPKLEKSLWLNVNAIFPGHLLDLG